MPKTRVQSNSFLDKLYFIALDLKDNTFWPQINSVKNYSMTMLEGDGNINACAYQMWPETDEVQRNGEVQV